MMLVAAIPCGSDGTMRMFDQGLHNDICSCDHAIAFSCYTNVRFALPCCGYDYDSDNLLVMSPFNLSPTSWTSA
jgi:hypothetical protein